MVCKHCGTQNPDSSTFCQGCGAKLGGSGTAGSNGAGGNNSYGGNTAGFNGSTGGYAGNNGGFQGGNYNQNSNFNRSQLPNTASIPEEYQPISMWGYFGYELLFSIPLVGFILLLVFSFGGTRILPVLISALRSLLLFFPLFSWEVQSELQCGICNQ